MDTRIFCTMEGDRISDYYELENKLNDNNIYPIFIDQNYRIKMVGRYLFSDNMLWYSFPKYYPRPKLSNGKLSKEDQEYIKLLVKVFEKLRARGRKIDEGDLIFSPYHKDSRENRVNILNLSSFILHDYISNGLYKRQDYIYTTGGNGKTSWVRTVKNTTPIINEDNILYTNICKRKYYADYDNIVTNIHANIVTYAMNIFEEYYGDIEIKTPIKSLEIQKDKLYTYTSILNNELYQVYADREISLIKALIAFCGITNNYRIRGCTNCFQNVWEWVNDAVFGNQTTKNSQNPEYTLFNISNERKKYNGGGLAKPDTIYFSKTKKSNKHDLYVYDAKYYIPTIVEAPNYNSINNYPPNSDIVKQIAYLDGIVKSIEKQGECVNYKNIFLVPSVSDLEKHGYSGDDTSNLYFEFGYVTRANYDEMAKSLLGIDLTADEGEKELDSKEKVYLYSVNCLVLYEMFLKGDKSIPPTKKV